MLPRRTVAALLLAVGLVAGTVAYGAWCVRATFLDAEAIGQTAEDVLDVPRARDAVVNRLADAIGAQLPPGSGADRATLERAATAAVRDPAFREAFGNGLEAIHRHAFDEVVGPIVLDPAPVVIAARAGLSTVDPVLGSLLPTTAPVTVSIDTADIPDLTGAARQVDLAMGLAGVLAVALVTAGTLLHPYRPWAVGRIGRWMVGVGVVQILVFWGLPHLVLLTLSGWASVAAALILGLFPVLLPAALVLVLGGGMVIAAAARWARAHPSRRSVLAPVAQPRAGNVWTRV